MSAPSFARLTFASPDQRASELAEFALANLTIPRSGPLRVLDIGCGNGATLRAIGARLARAELTGVDISADNIAAAQAAPPGPCPINFRQGDYRLTREGKFDVILADSTLQLIDGDTGDLIAKLAADLNGGGDLFCSLPFACWQNRLLYALRRILLRCRGPALEHLLLRLARLVYGRRFPVELLRQRVEYCFILPHRIHDPALTKSLADAGIRLLQSLPAAGFLGKPRSRLLHFRKDNP